MLHGKAGIGNYWVARAMSDHRVKMSSNGSMNLENWESKLQGTGTAGTSSQVVVGLAVLVIEEENCDYTGNDYSNKVMTDAFGMLYHSSDSSIKSVTLGCNDNCRFQRLTLFDYHINISSQFRWVNMFTTWLLTNVIVFNMKYGDWLSLRNTLNGQSEQRTRCPW